MHRVEGEGLLNALSGMAHTAIERDPSRAKTMHLRPHLMKLAVDQFLNGGIVDEPLLPHLQIARELATSFNNLLSPPKKPQSLFQAIRERLSRVNIFNF